MYNVQFKVSEQSLIKTGGISTYASDTVEYVKADFVFDDSWDGYDSIKAIWQNGSVKKSSPLDSEGSCTVPAEVVTDKGTVKVNLVGTTVTDDVVSKRITTFQINAFTVTVKVNIDADSPQPISPSEYEQFVASVKHDADRAETGAESAEASASSASDSAEQATLSAQASEASAITASNYASDARGHAQNASDSADASASSATASANSASASAQSASDSADSASASAESAREAEEAKETILTMRAVARSLPEGSQATASYENGLLTLGIPKGDKGDTGNGIDHVQLNSDYTLTIFFTDGTQTQTTSIRGEKGETGAVPNFSIGEVTTLDEHEQATATIEGTAEEPILNLGIPQGKTGEVSYEDLSSLLPKDSASGDIISIPDGQSIIPVESLKVTLEPIQDLNGYDKPWAGGAGRNLLNVGGRVNQTNAGVQYTSDENYIIGNGTKDGGGYAPFPTLGMTLDAGTYYARGFVVSGTATNEVSAYITDGSNNLTNGGILTTEKPFTLESQTTVYPRFAVWNDGTVLTDYTVGIVISKTSGIDKFYPYSNIAPISGWTDVDTYRTGINVWDEAWEVGRISTATGQNTIATGIRSKNYVPVLPSTTHYVKSSINVYVLEYDADKNYLRYASYYKNQPYTTSANAHYIRFYQIDVTTYNNDISINYPNTDHDYHAYQGDTYHTEIEGNYTVTSTDNVPYLLKEVSGIDGDRLREKIVGGTIAWNQLMSPTDWNTSTTRGVSVTNNNDGTYTFDGTASGKASKAVQKPFTQGHVYLLAGCPRGGSIETYFLDTGANLGGSDIGNGHIGKCGFATGEYYVRFYVMDGTTVTNMKVVPQLIDLTQMFGSTIADYIYSLEQANAGDGVAFFKKLFPKDYYAYDAGSLKSVQTSAHVTKDADDNVIGNYPLDSSLTLRGIPKLDASNSLYYDGDTYESDGTVTRKYGVVDLGTLTWSVNASDSNKQDFLSTSLASVIKRVDEYTLPNAICSIFVAQVRNAQSGNPTSNYNTIGVTASGNLRVLTSPNTYADAQAFKTAMSGVYLIYELATPTTEQADPFEAIQKVINGGTEEYIDTRDVPIPVGHDTEYLSRVTYGCTIDLVSGECVIDKVYQEYDLSTLSYTTINGYDNWTLALSNVSTGASSSVGKISNITEYAYAGSTLGRSHFYLGGSSIALYLTEGTARSAVASFAYPLATPQIIQLTPQEIKLLVGDNTIWSYGIIELAYSADVTKWLMKKLNS